MAHIENQDEFPTEDVDTEPMLSFELESSLEVTKEIKPKVDEYWTVQIGKANFLYALIVSENPLSVKYFETTVQGKLTVSMMMNIQLIQKIWVKNITSQN